LELRRQDVTASVIGALAGVHPYVSARKLYLAHSGFDFPEEENEAMRRGRIMEPAVAASVTEQRPDWTLEKNEYYYRDPTIRLGATPDYLIHGDARGLGVLQIKTTEQTVFARDWANGAEIPLYIELQTALECMMVDAAFGEVAVMITPSRSLKCTILPVPRLPGVERKIIAQAKQFWDDVAAGREPDLNYGKDFALVKRMQPQEIPGKVVDLSGDNVVPDLLARRARLTEEIKQLTAAKEAISCELAVKMGDAERATGIPDWSLTYKTVKERVQTVRAHRELRAYRKDQS
jgi:predicted phage-related endonuclease